MSGRVGPVRTKEARERCLCDAVLTSQRLLRYATRRIPGPHVADLLGRQPCVPVPRPSRLSLAALRPHVRNVVRLRTEPQVGRIAARAVVAAMKHLHPIWDWPMGQLPRHSMRLLLPLLVVNDAVARVVPPCCPWPASVGTSRAVDPICHLFGKRYDSHAVQYTSYVKA
jgi:hypothetical protein